MATIKDVARLAGVSTATVSRVLNKSGDVSDVSRRKVERAIAELHYHPSAMARILQTGRARLVGVVLPALDHPYFARLLQAVENTCAERGYRLLVCVTEGKPEKGAAFASTLRRNRADGLLLCGYAKDAALFEKCGVPAVSIERTADGTIPSVFCDNYTGGVLAARALLDGGCRHPMVLGEASDRQGLPAQQRVSGFTEACARSGTACVVYDGDKSRAEKSETYQSFFRELMDAYPETDGLFTTSDVIAAWASAAFGEMSLLVPERIQLVGFDGLDIAEYLGITTVAQPVAQMGEFALDMLLKLAGGDLVPEKSMLPVELIRRRSTLPPKTGV